MAFCQNSQSVCLEPAHFMISLFYFIFFWGGEVKGVGFSMRGVDFFLGGRVRIAEIIILVGFNPLKPPVKTLWLSSYQPGGSNIV